MKNYKIVMMSVILLFFLIGTVSAFDDTSENSVSINLEENNEVIQSSGNVNEIYVNDTGDDSNTGTQNSPYASINKAILDVNSSDEVTIYLSQGIFGTDDDSNININFNHRADGGNLTIVGSGADKTFIDGQSAFKFATVGPNSILTVKNITFINFKSTNGGVFWLNNGILNIENCVFRDSYSTSSKGGVIYATGSLYSTNRVVLKIMNSEFISCYVLGNDGGAIYTNELTELFLENNTFINTRISGGCGVAVYNMLSRSSKFYYNKFINLTGYLNDASLCSNTMNEDTTYFINNTFINCSNPSTSGSIAYLNGKIILENNSFINASNSLGNIYIYGSQVNNLNFNVNGTINIGNYEVNNGAQIPIVNITDDMGNIIHANGYQIKFIGEKINYTFYPRINGNVTKIVFNEIPENGIYNVTILYFSQQLSTGILTTANVSISNNIVELYVSPNGSDANDGTIDNPFDTIQHAIDKGFEESFNVIIHLFEGTYSDMGNVELTIANKGSLQLIGEKYNKTIIDGKNCNWFLSVGSSTKLNIANLKFINGESASKSLIGSSSNVFLKDCIFDNNTVTNVNQYTLVDVAFDNLIYTNNHGRMRFQSNKELVLSNSYFAFNTFSDLNYGGIILLQNKNARFENCTFVNNSASLCGVIFVSTTEFKSKNNVYENNSAYEKDNYNSYGVICGDSGCSKIIFENDTFRNNNAKTTGVFGVRSDNTFINFTACKFIDNSAKEAGVGILSLGYFENCLFKNNSGKYAGTLIIYSILNPYDNFKLINVTFDSNVGYGRDIYLKSLSVLYRYALDLTINYNNLSTNSLSDNLIAKIIVPCGAQVSGGNVHFILGDNDIGATEIINGTITFNYAGFDTGNYILSGYIDSTSQNTIVNNGTVTVRLEGIMDNVEYWISEYGSDENGDGSKDNPFKSIFHAYDLASKCSRNIIIHIGEGTFSGDLNTKLLLSSMNNLIIVGEGVDKTIIDGENSNYFAIISDGKNKVTISNLTIQNMLPNNFESKIINDYSPITVREGANLYLNNLIVTNNHGGVAIILNEGSLYINNSIFNKNGFTTSGIIFGGVVNIDNSFIENTLEELGLITAKLFIINNSIIKNAFNYNPSNYAGGAYSLIMGNGIIENTKISNNGDNSSLRIFGIDEVTNYLVPALSIEDHTGITTMIAGDVFTILNNVSMVNEYGSPVNVREFTFMFPSTFLSPLGYHYGTYSRNVTVTNSSFVNFDYLFVINNVRGVMNYSFDGCYIKNIPLIWKIKFSSSSSASIKNSLIWSGIDDETCNIYSSIMSLENNYWFDNNQPVIKLSPTGSVTFTPSTWIILVKEGNKYLFKLTDGENITDYSGSLPAKISYIVDDNGDIIPVLNINGTGYKFNVDENGNIVLNTTNPLSNIVPKIPVDETIFSNDITVIVGDDSKFTANFTDQWGDPLKDTKVVFIVEGNSINVNTDVNGVASFDINFILGTYTITITNPVTGQSIFRNINIITKNTIEVIDVVSYYNDKSKFSVMFTDSFGKALINTNVNFCICNKVINVITDDRGVASFDINFDAGNYEVIITNPVTGQELIKEIVVNKVNTKLIVHKFNAIYNAGKALVVTLTDTNGNKLSNKELSMTIDGKIYKKVTDKNGQVKFIFNLVPKTYFVNINFAGDNNYIKSFVKTNIVFVKATPKIIAYKKIFKVKTKTKKYTITLKNNKKQGMKKVKVTLKVKGKIYKATTNTKGKATFKIIKLNKKGKYTALIKYSGNKYYKGLNKKIKITVR